MPNFKGLGFKVGWAWCIVYAKLLLIHSLSLGHFIIASYMSPVSLLEFEFGSKQPTHVWL